MAVTVQELVERLAVLEEKCEQIIRDKKERVIVEKHTDKMLNSMNTKLEKSLTMVDLFVERVDKKDKSEANFKRTVYAGIAVAVAVAVIQMVLSAVDK